MSLENLLKQVATKGKDQTEATSGGGDYTPPEAGVTGARLVAYYEVGQHESEYKGEKKVKDEVELVFELIGKKHPVKEINGEKVPVRLTLRTNLSTNEKAWFYKWFSALRTEERHFSQLLGKPLMLEVEHVKRDVKGTERTYANIKKDSLRKPRVHVPDPETGELVETEFKVGPAVSELRAFVWDFATPEYWDAIFIPGEYPERKDEETGKVIAPAKSKNVVQLKIASALNFKGLACYEYAAAKLAGDDSVTREGIEALDEAVGDVNNAEDPDDPMAGIE